jgi:protein-L-isoaspartate(D-aspartate) O-methyltransferase
MNPNKESSNDTGHKNQLRQELVESIKEKGITDSLVLSAISVVPRHLFMPPELEDSAYEDNAFPIGKGQTISQPYTVAYQSQLLEIKPSDRILEVGTGSMYQACVLSFMGAEVYTIERQKELFEKSRAAEYLETCKNVHLFYGDGFEGLPEYAPFDKIIITAAAPFVPPKLVEQLKNGGIMVLPIGTGRIQTMTRIIKNNDGSVEKQSFHSFSFVPMLKGTSD